MIAALALMCAVHSGVCQTSAAQRIATAIDAATDDERLRADLVVYAWLESRFQEHPRPESWDSRAGLAHGAWQLWGSEGSLPLAGQARAWLRRVQTAGLASVDSSPTRARRRAAAAERLLATAAAALEPPR